VHGADVVFLPSHVAIQAINADVQNLGIKRGELFAVAVERRHLLSSSRRPVQRMKTDDDVLLSAKVAEANPDARLAFHCWQVEIWCNVPNLQNHAVSSRDILHVPYKH